MKKAILAACVIMVAAAGAFADGLWIGPSALYSVPLDRGSISETGPEAFTESFLYGLDAKLELGILKGEASFLHMPSTSPYFPKGFILSMLDVGLGLDLLIFNFGVGVGPNYLFPVISEVPVEAADIGVNLKASAGVKLGKLGLNLYAIYLAESFAALAATDFENSSFLLGMNLQFKL
jgi:hypothetical protein